MNLHAVVTPAIGSVNPFVPVTVLISDGYTTAADGRQIPIYFPPQVVMGQVQPMAAGEIAQTEGLNIQGTKRAIYLNGRFDGLVRNIKKGGDLIVMQDGTEWLIVAVLEQFPDWCKVAVTLQRRGLIALPANP